MEFEIQKKCLKQELQAVNSLQGTSHSPSQMYS